MSPAVIPQFPELYSFDFLECLTIDKIKVLLGVNEIQFRTVKSLEGTITSFLCHWDFDRKLTIKIERALAHQIKADRAIPLNLARKLSGGKNGPYNLFTITIYEFAEEKGYGEWEAFDQYSEYNGYNGWTDDDIDSAFEGDPENTWNVD
jgi:hypothetical protein